MTNITRKNFYQGQLVTPDDMNNLEQYTDNISHAMVNDILGAGIVSGFEVVQENSLEIRISAGVAYDQYGTRLILESDTIKSIASLLPTAGIKNVFLGIKRDYIQSEPELDTQGKPVFTKWTPTVSFEIAENLTPEFFQISKIELDKNGITNIILNNILFPILSNNSCLSLNTDRITWNGKDILDIIYPIGILYKQLPNQNTNIFETNEEPSYLFGGVWELQYSGKSYFERFEGISASENRTNGIQNDCIRNITGGIQNMGNRSSMQIQSGQNLFYGSTERTGIASLSRDLYTNPVQIYFNTSRVVPTGSENRPMNILKREWKRVK